ncbi:MAG: hypothetical protein GY888_24555 [Planctomycetaceae bacterium]|nr:hypothetical protein [Planctomycetaceae bacterium]
MGIVSSWATGCLCIVLVASGLLLLGRRRLRGSTLMVPWAWCWVGLWSLALMEIGRGDGLEGATAWYFSIGVSTILPGMALLGAQRPHDRIWQFVVLSLWVILVLPAVKNMLLEPGSVFQLHPAWGWFVWLLILLGWVNRIGTRYWLAALLVAVGQCLVLAGHLPGLNHELGAIGTVSGLGCFTAAILMVQLQLRGGTQSTVGFDRAWIDFRDQFGTLWALRVADRINMLAERHQSNVRLTWQGLRDGSGDNQVPRLDVETEAILHQNLKNLLRRFVPVDWIATRLPVAADSVVDERVS